MDAWQVLARFEEFLSAKRIEVASAPPEVGFEAMLRFYAERRVEGCDLEADGDMLLFQWGMYDWGEGPEFELDLTRQVIFPDEEDDDAIWQLHLTYHYQPTGELRALGADDRWCPVPADLPGFREFILASKPYQLLRAQPAAKVSAFYECAG
jgi:hypothetical protein